MMAYVCMYFVRGCSSLALLGVAKGIVKNATAVQVEQERSEMRNRPGTPLLLLLLLGIFRSSDLDNEIFQRVKKAL